MKSIIVLQFWLKQVKFALTIHWSAEKSVTTNIIINFISFPFRAWVNGVLLYGIPKPVIRTVGS